MLRTSWSCPGFLALFLVKKPISSIRARRIPGGPSARKGPQDDKVKKVHLSGALPTMTYSSRLLGKLTDTS